MKNAPLFPAVQGASVPEPTETSGRRQDPCGLCFHGEWSHTEGLVNTESVMHKA